MALSFIEPTAPGDRAAFEALNWDYLAFLRVQPEPMRSAIDHFYSDENYRAALAKPYTRPDGLTRLAQLDSDPIGCGTIQTFAPGDAEIKRVFVSPPAQGSGAGYALMHQLIEDCREMGFRRILMDTGRPLLKAQELYDRMGFRRRGPYGEVPEVAREVLVFFEMELA